MYAALDVLTQLAPCFHGFYRALISFPFPWSSAEWSGISVHLNKLFLPDIIDRLNRLLIDVIPVVENDPELARFVTTFVSRYVARGRPLSGYFIVCCVTEAQWTILAQALVGTHSTVDSDILVTPEAAATNRAWQLLQRHPIKTTHLADGEFEKGVQMTMTSAMETFSTLLVQIEDMDAEPSEDSYAWETMSECLV